MCNFSAEGCTGKKEGGQIAPTRTEEGEQGKKVVSEEGGEEAA
jgi:hypothetical protein